jgi:hypothetical protein
MDHTWLRGGGNGDEHPGPGYLISSIRRSLKYKIYSPRSVSLLGFVASYIKKSNKNKAEPGGICPARCLGAPRHLSVLSTSFPLFALISTPSPPPPHRPLASTPRSRLHIHRLYARHPSHAQGQYPLTVHLESEGGVIWLGDFRRCYALWSSLLSLLPLSLRGTLFVVVGPLASSSS